MYAPILSFSILKNKSLVTKQHFLVIIYHYSFLFPYSSFLLRLQQLILLFYLFEVIVFYFIWNWFEFRMTIPFSNSFCSFSGICWFSKPHKVFWSICCIYLVLNTQLVKSILFSYFFSIYNNLFLFL